MSARSAAAHRHSIPRTVIARPATGDSLAVLLVASAVIHVVFSRRNFHDRRSHPALHWLDWSLRVGSCGPCAVCIGGEAQSRNVTLVTSRAARGFGPGSRWRASSELWPFHVPARSQRRSML